ncbi:MAG: hypothetical protein ACFFCS_23905 [Candidatus Hodarchaeota archaeon]
MKWCDFDCEHATTDETGNLTGACRREIVLYCKKFKKNVIKNKICIEILREMKKNDPEYIRRFGNQGVQ